MLKRYMWCTQIFCGLNVFPHNNNNTCLPISVSPFTVLLGTLFGWTSDHTTIWTILWSALFESHQVYPMILLQSWWSHLFSFSLMPSWVLGKEISHTVLCLVGKDVWNDGHFVLTQKFMHRQSRMSRWVLCWRNSSPAFHFWFVFTTLIPTDTVRCDGFPCETNS